MNIKRIVYWAALAVTGLGAAALKLWAFLLWSASPQAPGPWGWGNVHHFGPGFPPLGFGLPLIVLLVVGLALWYGRKGRHGPWADPWEALGMEYAEGRISRDEFFARRAVLEEMKWK